MARWWCYLVSTTVILATPCFRNYVGDMTLVLMMVVLAFGLLYVAVVAEERQMQEATKPRKR
jgi:protein-S-isoprenylcysteine O-methyltransferase Ste14